MRTPGNISERSFSDGDGDISEKGMENNEIEAYCIRSYERFSLFKWLTVNSFLPVTFLFLLSLIA